VNKKRNGCIVAAASLLLAANAHALPYTFQSIDVPFAGASETEVFDISNSGTAVGSYLDEAGKRRGFVLESGTYSTIDAPGASATRLFGVNGLGQTVGVYQSAAEPGVQHGFVRNADGSFNTIDFPGQTFNYAFRINDSGQVGGYFFEFPGGDIFITTFRREADGTFGTRLRSSEGDGTVMRGLNDAGDQTGWWLKPDGGIQGLIHSGDGFALQFDVPDAAFTLPNDINNAGMVAGYAAPEDFEGRGFVRNPDGTFDFIALPGAESTQIFGINDRGQLVGAYEDADGNLHGFIAQIPEPQSLLLVTFGVIILLFSHRHRRTNSQHMYRTQSFAF
jgi:uncharacterized membrane protein